MNMHSFFQSLLKSGANLGFSGRADFQKKIPNFIDLFLVDPTDFPRSRKSL